MREIFCLKDTSPSNISTRSNNYFIRSCSKTVYKGENSLRIFGPIVWDELLPDKIKYLDNFLEFKRKIKSWIPENCPCRLCKSFIPRLGFTSVV